MVASQPINEGGQSPGAPEMLGAPSICKYFLLLAVGTLRTKFSHRLSWVSI